MTGDNRRWLTVFGSLSGFHWQGFLSSGQTRKGKLYPKTNWEQMFSSHKVAFSRLANTSERERRWMSESAGWEAASHSQSLQIRGVETMRELCSLKMTERWESRTEICGCTETSDFKKRKNISFRGVSLCRSVFFADFLLIKCFCQPQIWCSGILWIYFTETYFCKWSTHQKVKTMKQPVLNKCVCW